MHMPKNAFKTLLTTKQNQIGLWNSLPGSYVVEALAGAGYDWILIDTEHSPGDPLTVLSQLQAIAAYPVSAVVRPATNDAVLIKRFLDIGAQTLLIPYVQNADEARYAVSAMRYPPRGIRGVSAITRATRFGRVADYGMKAHDELCLLVQVETLDALARLEEIAAVDGVDGVFIGPADLAASMGYIGQGSHPEVKLAILNAISRLKHLNIPSGILTPDVTFANECIQAGTAFTAVGVDAAILSRSVETLLRQFQ